MSRLQARKIDLWIMAGFFLLPCLLYWNVTFGSRTMLPADNLFQWQPWASVAPDFNVDVPHNTLLSDLILENLAWKQFIVEGVRQREIPLWNPYIFAGTPFLATGQHSGYYPFSLLFLVLPLAKAYGWYTVSQLWLAGVLAFVFGRVLGLRRTSAAVAGLVFQGCGFIVVSAAVFPMILGAAVWLPLLLACVEKVIRNATDAARPGRTLPWAALGAVALGCQTLAGHIEITYYTLLVMGLYAAWRLISLLLQARPGKGSEAQAPKQTSRLLTPLKPAAWLLALVAVGLMLGSVQFIPFVEVGRSNFREGAASLAEIRSYAFPARRLLTLIVPDFFGNPADHAYVDVFSSQTVRFDRNYYGQPNPRGAYSSNWGIKNYVEGGIYLGILPLILAALGLWSVRRHGRDRRPNISFFAGLAALSLSFVFGAPTYALLYHLLPGINQLHSPFRWVFPFSLCVAVLAGYGLDHVAETRKSELENRDRNKRLKQESPSFRLKSLITLGAQPSMVTLLAGIAIWLGLMLLAGLYLARAQFTRLESTVETLFLNLAQAPDAFPDAEAFFSYEFQQLFLLGLMLVSTGIALRVSRCRLRLRGRSLWGLVVVVVIGLDLYLAGSGFNSAADPAVLAYQPALVQWLKQQPGLWRLTVFAPHGDKPLNANTPWLYGLQDIRGYDSVILKQYTDYMAAVEPQNELQFNRIQPIANWQSLNSPLLDLLGVKYIVTAETVDLPKLRVAWQGEGLTVYENLAVVPRVYTIPRTATAVVDQAQDAMRMLDPRLYVLVERSDWDGVGPAQPSPQALAAAEIVAYGNIEVKVRASVREPSWLVLNDTYFRGWDAFVRPLTEDAGGEGEERAIEITRVNGNFRGVTLEPGQWEVRFRYSPLTFKLGGLTSFMGGIIILFSVIVWSWRRYYNPRGELTSTRSVAKNSLVPMMLNLFNRVIDFAYAAFYLRVLGPADSGRFATAIIIAGWFEILSNFGLNTLVIREVSKDKSQASRYLLNTTILRLGTGFAATWPVLLYLWGIRAAGNPLDANTTLAILLLMAGMVFSGMGQGLAGLYYAYEVAEFNAAVTTVTTILKVGFGVLALLLGYGFLGLAAVSILVSAITLLILSISAFRQFDLSGPWQIDFRLQGRMVGQSYPLMLNHLLAVIFFQIDVPILRQSHGEAVVGWYNSAYKWINGFNVVPSFFTFALFPVISRQVQNSLSDAQRSLRMALKLMVLVALPLAATTTLLAPLMIAVLGGDAFLPHGAVALQLVVWSIPLGWLNSVVNYVLIALGFEKRLTQAFVIGVTFNLVTNLLLVPRFSYLAASLTTIASEMVLLAAFVTILRRAMPGVRWLEILVRPLAITAVMLWAMWLGNQVNLILALFLGLTAYPLGLWLLKVFSEEERRILSSLLPERLVHRIAQTTTESRTKYGD